MTYQAPDYEQVKLNVTDMFANYLVTGCPPDESEASAMNDACSYSTFVSLGWSFMCYSTHNP